jgi:hypothetical protein
MQGTVRLSRRCGCLSAAGVFTNQLNNKETKQQRKTGSSTFSLELAFTLALTPALSPGERENRSPTL